MRRSTRGKMLLLAGMLCLVAQSVVAVPDCRCADVPDGPPCHRSSVPERSACCAGDPSTAPATPCGMAMQAPCCQGDLAATEAPRAVLPAPHTDAAPMQPAIETLAFDRPVVRPHRARVAVPAPPGEPAWLRHSALLN